MIDVYVGETKEHFSVPKELLESKSAVFERMLNNGLKESRENKVELPEDAVADFQGLMEYLLGWNPSLIFADDCKREVGVAKGMDWLQYRQKYTVRALQTVFRRSAQDLHRVETLKTGRRGRRFPKSIDRRCPN